MHAVSGPLLDLWASSCSLDWGQLADRWLPEPPPPSVLAPASASTPPAEVTPHPSLHLHLVGFEEQRNQACPLQGYPSSVAGTVRHGSKEPEIETETENVRLTPKTSGRIAPSMLYGWVPSRKGPVGWYRAGHTADWQMTSVPPQWAGSETFPHRSDIYQHKHRFASI